MNSNQVQSVARAILLSAGAVLVAKGKLTDPGLQELVGAVMSIAAFTWSMIHHANAPQSS